MSNGIEFNREWAMPNSATFEIEPIRKLVQRELDNSNGTWIDPFAGESSMADITNDLNPEKRTDYTLPATEFLDKFNRCEIDGGVLFDPPYSPRQIRRCMIP